MVVVATAMMVVVLMMTERMRGDKDWLESWRCMIAAIMLT